MVASGVYTTSSGKICEQQFSLGKLDGYGQRINIEITLPRKDKTRTISFISGWITYPDGVIKLTTSYGGAI